ncbi:hypothetical protein TNCV_4997491 [Trichonephila clavipes]|nr:hypothetical protein TNCV_4997491 [Trichonephila clavipes]
MVLAGIGRGGRTDLHVIRKGDFTTPRISNASVHALCHRGAECHLVVGSSMLVVLVVPILGWSVLAVDNAGVVVQ